MQTTPCVTSRLETNNTSWLSAASTPTTLDSGHSQQPTQGTLRGNSLFWCGQWIRLPSEVFKHYRFSKSVGEGTYGKVFLANVINSDGAVQTGKNGKPSTVAIKILSLAKRSEGVPPTTMREMALLKDLKHENIVKLFHIYVGTESIALVFETCETDLGHVLDMHIRNDAYLSRVYVRSLMFQILKGMYYVHREGILHRDVKPQNILLANHYTTVKLADFGLSRMIGFSPEHEQKNCTAITLWYRPPELLLGRSYYSTSADVFSVGCLFAEMLMTRTILNGTSELEQLRKTFSILDVPSDLRTVYPETERLAFLWEPIRREGPRLRSLLPLIMDPYAADLLMKMLALDPARRITLGDALRHPFFSSSEAATVIHSFVPKILPSVFSAKVSEMIPKLTALDAGVSQEVEALYRSELARLARQTRKSKSDQIDM